MNSHRSSTQTVEDVGAIRECPTLAPSLPGFEAEVLTPFGCEADRIRDAAQLSDGKWRSRIRRLLLIAGVASCSFMLLLGLQLATGSHSTELSAYPDEPAHYVTGMMLREYLLGGWREASPLKFAEDYYSAYPKVAFGHYPPLYYVMQFIWTLPFSHQIPSILVLQAVFLALMATAIWATRKDRYGFAAAAAFIAMPITLRLNSQVMAEPLLALVSFGAAVFLARYYSSYRFCHLAAFGLFALLGVMTKGSGIVLFGLPIGLSLVRHDWTIFRRRSFWILYASILGFLVPYQAYVWRMANEGMSGPINAELLIRQGGKFLKLLPSMMGWPLLAAMAIGLVYSLLSRARSSIVLEQCCAVLVVATIAFHSISPTGVEQRRLFMALPAMLLLAVAAIRALSREFRTQPWGVLIPLGIVALSIAPIRLLPSNTPVGYRGMASWLQQETGNQGQAILVASETDGEGMLISEIAQRSPKPGLIIVRTSKLLMDSNWLGTESTLLATSQQEVREVIDTIPTQYIVVDQFEGVTARPEVESVRRLVEENPQQWLLRHREPAWFPHTRQPGQIRVYQRLGMSSTMRAHVRIDVRRTLGRFIER